MKISLQQVVFVDNHITRVYVLPKEQLEFYLDEEIYGTSIDLNSVKSISIDECGELAAYDELGLGIRFKPPISHFEGSQFEEWNGGFINGALIVRGQ